MIAYAKSKTDVISVDVTQGFFYNVATRCNGYRGRPPHTIYRVTHSFFDLEIIPGTNIDKKHNFENDNIISENKNEFFGAEHIQIYT